jgi:hypothetical protein
MNEHPTQDNLSELVAKDTQVLYQAQTFFPLDLFPKKIVIYLTHIDVIDLIYFGSKHVETILIKDIYSVQSQTNPFFGALKIVNRQITIPEVNIEKLRASEAVKLRNIIQGLVIATVYKTDVMEMQPTELVPKLEELGMSQAQ